MAPTGRLIPLLQEVRACRLCEAHLPHGPRPVVQAAESARLLIIGQAPGRKVHDTGIPWNDASGRRLRHWLGMDADVFYDPDRVAILPTGFCYPGKGRSGDLPPRPECAPRWHAPLRERLPQVRLTLLIGRHAQLFALRGRNRPTLTETVAAWRDYLPEFLPLPHPSPRNQAWWPANPWFERELLPELKRLVAEALQDNDVTP
ncbi:Uracil-DNA glycosylase [Noviherbaspirillum humi]|uniref:Uracil-DNA glycosylase n=1 Tax=Noviherbaspirillum humi TaxID=1688639 RepID=A0A239BTU2_9BURK|nr:uracil-DNA glycosylase family protein [Noviherbaspirillum humi]SNS11079.1 Uracil-DNA glycosylase [Noviherbaspirillum humi]